MQKEVWKDIKDYEGLYQVSNLGNVKSIDKIIKRKNGIEQHFKEKIINKWNSNYAYVNLSKNGKGKTYTIHRLVAQAFIDNPNNYPCVNHKDENKKNNNVNNLEWCDYKYNNNYNFKMNKIRDKLINGKLSKKVIQYDMNDNLIKLWKSTMQIERCLNYKNQSISNCCKGKQKTAYGYKWKYKD